MYKIFVFLIVACISSFACAGTKTEVGFLTGSFDPPHLGHKDLIETAMRDYPLKKLVIIVNSVGTKDYNASVDQRIEMLNIMLSKHAKHIEVLMGRPESDLDKVSRVMEKEKLKRGYRIIGEDDFQAVSLQEVADAKFHWVVMIRNELFPIETIKKYKKYKNVEWNNNIVKGKSSTSVREKLSTKKNVLPDLDLEVARYIRAKKLYTTPEGDEASAKEAKFKQAYKEYMREVHETFKALKNIPEETPEFKSSQSVEAWNAYFMKYLLAKNNLDKKQTEELFDLTIKLH